MGADTSVIGILNTCFIVSLSFCILFFIITVILFIVFDIKSIFDMKTGRAKAKTVSQMQKANASTGRLRVDGKTMTTELSEKRKKKGRAPAVVPPPKTETGAPASSQPAGYGSEQTSVLSQDDNYGDNQTSVLAQNEDVSQQNTASPQPVFNETTVLSEVNLNPSTDENLKANNPNVSESIHFTVKKEVMLINSDEIL
ncbi:MAG: hypothetical protein IIU14_02260 [Ruminococcus sp.]|nr:hypothetical protein [Ruminococcus sp.]